MLKDVIEQGREDVARITAPKAQALFETTAGAAGPHRDRPD
jgi:hypothetical protein